LQLFEREQELEASGGGGGNHKVAELDEALKRAHEVISRMEREALNRDQEVDRLSRALTAYVRRLNRKWVELACTHTPTLRSCLVHRTRAMAETSKPTVGKLSVCAMCKESISHSFAETADPDSSTIAFPMVKGRFPVQTAATCTLLT
jgi:hypothetical protein